MLNKTKQNRSQELKKLLFNRKYYERYFGRTKVPRGKGNHVTKFIILKLQYTWKNRDFQLEQWEDKYLGIHHIKSS